MSSKDVPYNLVPEVLTWLPVKSLIRFRCVCKLWNSSITNRNFIHTHLNKANLLCKNVNNLVYTQSVSFAPSKLCMVTCKSDRTITEVSRLELPCCPTVILGVCNGLVCFIVKTGIDYIIYLWNPSIRKFKKLPTSLTSYLIKPHKLSAIVAAFGFAYHSQNNDYKIVKISCLHDPWSIKEVQSFEAEVYKLSTNSWRRLEPQESLRRKFSYFSFKDWSNPLFSNGALHWLVHFHGNNGWYPSIVSFDVHDEKFHSIELPKNGIYFPGCLADYKGLLAWFTLSFSRGCILGTCLWVMKEYGVVKSWAIQTELPQRFVGFHSYSSTAGEFLVKGYDDCDLALLDPETQCVNRLGIQGVITWIAHTTNALQSLVLVEE